MPPTCKICGTQFVMSITAGVNIPYCPNALEPEHQAKVQEYIYTCRGRVSLGKPDWKEDNPW